MDWWLLAGVPVTSFIVALSGATLLRDLRDLPEFIRYCRPYTDTTNAEPALVIPCRQRHLGVDRDLGQ